LEVAIVCGMAKATLPSDIIDWDYFVADYDRIRDKIEEVFPELFAEFNKRIRRLGGFHLTNPPRQRVWNTATSRANFLVFPGVEEDSPVSDPAALRLATLRSHDQYNTTIYSLDDRYRGVFGGRMVVFMNEADMRNRGITEGDMVEIESLAEDGKRRVVGGFWVKPYSIPIGSIGAYYPETNPLLPLAYHDLKSGTPAAKSIPVLVRLRPQLDAGR
jgi:anaerobic selenocysteine-containing dehydrogenase